MVSFFRFATWRQSIQLGTEFFITFISEERVLTMFGYLSIVIYMASKYVTKRSLLLHQLN
jgi:hypothetical protein